MSDPNAPGASTPDGPGGPDEPGPPPPPPAAQRAAGPGGADEASAPPPRPGRPRWGLIIAAAVLVLGLPVAAVAALLVATWSGEPTAESEVEVEPAPDDDADDGDGGAGEGTPAPEAPAGGAELPDPSELSGRDAAVAAFLADVTASEEAMVAFQERQREALGQAASGDADPDAILAELGEAAEEGLAGLAEARPALEESSPDADLETVRSAYLAHHDAWVDYLEAIVEDPSVVFREAEDGRWTLSINATAESFADELSAVLDEDLDADVRAYGQQLLEGGFEQEDVVPEV